MSTDSTLMIKQVSADSLPMDLLLDADPSKSHIHAYTQQDQVDGALGYQASFDDKVVGVAVVIPLSESCYELKNIAIDESIRAKGIGSRLLKLIISDLRKQKVDRLEVGTGAFGYQLAYYQKLGFRADSIVKDFFLDHYDEPIIENDIQHKDMIRLAVDLKD